jgi:hypothetical protein
MLGGGGCFGSGFRGARRLGGGGRAGGTRAFDWVSFTGGGQGLSRAGDGGGGLGGSGGGLGGRGTGGGRGLGGGGDGGSGDGGGWRRRGLGG